MAREQDTIALNQARNAQRESKEVHKANIEDLDKLRRAVGMVMAGLGVLLGPMLPKMLLTEVGRLPDVV
jgi:hypothetical protein